MLVSNGALLSGSGLCLRNHGLSAYLQQQLAPCVLVPPGGCSNHRDASCNFVQATEAVDEGLHLRCDTVAVNRRDQHETPCLGYLRVDELHTIPDTDADAVVPASHAGGTGQYMVVTEMNPFSRSALLLGTSEDMAEYGV